MALPTTARAIIRPFRRDQKNDFANATGVAKYQARAGQILATKRTTTSTVGELRWRSDFGSRFHIIRHRKNTAILRELARYYAQEALADWDRRCIVMDCVLERVPSATDRERAVIVRVIFDVIDGGRVLARGLSATARIGG